MKVIFHQDFRRTYVRDPAAAPGRLDHALELVSRHYPVETARPCTDEDVLIVHTLDHLEDIKGEDILYDTALLATGATIQAAESAMQGEFAFALCRPPGHHASPGSSWGFCYFNNVAIAVLKLLYEERIGSALVVDFDLHFGDGTSNIFAGNQKVDYLHVTGGNRASFIRNLENHLERSRVDLVAVSAGFDRHIQDWGRFLTNEDYRDMGTLLGTHARENCQGRLFAVLEGGYNHTSLGEGILAFLQGVEGKSVESKS